MLDFSAITAFRHYGAVLMPASGFWYVVIVIPCHECIHTALSYAERQQIDASLGGRVP